MQRLRQLVTGLLTRRTAIDSLLVRVRRVVYHAALDPIFLQVFPFYTLSSIPATVPFHANLQDSAAMYNDIFVNTLRTGSFKLFKRQLPGFLTILTL